MLSTLTKTTIKISGLLAVALFVLAVRSVEIRREYWDGFPHSIYCQDTVDYYSSEEPDTNDTVQCVISANSGIVFNESIIWKDRQGISLDTGETHTNKTINISVTWGNESSSKVFLMVARESQSFNCSRYRTRIRGSTARIGLPHSLPCYAPDEMNGALSEVQYKSIKAVWYKGCREIKRDDPNYTYADGQFESDDIIYNRLKMKRVTFGSTPDLYRCILEYRNKTITSRIYRVCVQKVIPNNQPIITANEKEYIVAPGDDLTVQCYGNSGSGLSSVQWSKENDDECWVHVKIPAENCTFTTLRRKYCTALNESEIEKAKNVEPDYFTSSYTLRNLKYEDSGAYTCMLITTRDPVRANFTITVRAPPIAHKYLITAILSVLGVLFIGFLVALYVKYKLDIAFFIKKKLGKYLETDRPITYLIYTEDAFQHDRNKNPVNDVTKWLSSKSLRYIDPNDGKICNDAGMLVASHSKEVLEECLTLIVILTPNLLNGNTLDIFKTYSGFEDNIRRNLPLIFLCTCEMRNKIISGAKKGNDVLNTFRKFMNFKRNTVIHWNDKDQSKMKRHLYVALPKVRNLKTRHQIRHDISDSKSEII